MNKIFIGNKDTNEDLCLEDNTIIVFDSCNKDLVLKTNKDIKVFILTLFSNMGLSYETNNNTEVNVLSINSSIKFDISLMKDNITFNYFYSNINNSDNSYDIDIKHLGNNIVSVITNHGINTTNSKLTYTINTIVPKKYTGINTSQDSKIIVLDDNNATIKPNLLIDNDDIEASHAAYIGRFKEEDIFYLMTRGLSREDATDLLVRSFLIGNMNLSVEEKEIVLDNIKKHWR